MRRMLLTLFALLLATSVWAGDRPDWAQHKFQAAPDQVFDAAKTAILGQKHELKETDPATHTVHFRVGTSAWSWGYNMVLKVEADASGGSNVTIEIERSGGKGVSWGSGDKEVKKIFAHMDEQLNKKTAVGTAH